MNSLLTRIVITSMLLWPAVSRAEAPGPPTISPRLEMMLDTLQTGATVKVWVYLKDKDTSSADFQKAALRFTPRAMERRGRRSLDRYDLPVRDEYLRAVAGIGAQDIRASRWLNAIATHLTVNQVMSLAARDFVRRIEPVTRLTHPLPPDYSPDKTVAVDSADYGLSYIQNHMLGADSLHRAGITGNGVLLALFDTGYRIDHQAFDSMIILETWDFINNDPAVDDDVGIGQTEHGTATLSACGGYAPGELIGPAYHGQYILAKTEYQRQEVQIEEDYWVLAAEWADSLGADIISSSLGYSDWYTYADMDGNTAVTTFAADIAASRGILVVISAGNEGTTEWHYISAPADADSVIAVGAVNGNGIIAAFSSYGPTFDGRMKPEVAAMGVGDRCADDNGGYTFKSGTSLSAPLIAAAAALVIESIPSLRGDPMAVRERLTLSADHYANPDYHYGYGIPNLPLAAGYGLRILPIPRISLTVGAETTLTFTTLAPPGMEVDLSLVEGPHEADFTLLGDGRASLWVRAVPGDIGEREYLIAASAGAYADTLRFKIVTPPPDELVSIGPNPFRDSLHIFINSSFPGGHKIEVFTLSGELVFRTYGRENMVTWRGENEKGEKVASGVYVIRFSADGIERKVKALKL